MEEVKRLLIVNLIFLNLVGCASLYSRKEFAEKVYQYSKVILDEYKRYVKEDEDLDPESKKIRLKTVKELEEFLKEGMK
jgi:hypothetical protein